MTDNMFVLQNFRRSWSASHERSGLRVSLAQNTRQCHDWDSTATSSRAEFAAVACEVATVPIVSPPYVTPMDAMSNDAALDPDREAGCCASDPTCTPRRGGQWPVR